MTTVREPLTEQDRQRLCDRAFEMATTLDGRRAVVAGSWNPVSGNVVAIGAPWSSVTLPWEQIALVLAKHGGKFTK